MFFKNYVKKEDLAWELSNYKPSYVYAYRGESVSGARILAAVEEQARQATQLRELQQRLALLEDALDLVFVPQRTELKEAAYRRSVADDV